MDRCALALEYHAKGFNCCQSVLTACKDLIGYSEKDCLAIAGGFGKGMGGGTEVCGAVSGAVMALSLLAPHTSENDPWEKERIYNLSQKMQELFLERFGYLRCDALKEHEPPTDERFPTAVRLGIEKPCEVLIVTAVEMVEELAAQIPQKEA